jgi:hypothetical protein
MRIVSEQPCADGKYIRTYFGNSNESKPTSYLADGSVFVEVDTGKVFLYNETASSWVEQ